jgi:hypothetical protein
MSLFIRDSYEAGNVEAETVGAEELVVIFSRSQLRE